MTYVLVRLCVCISAFSDRCFGLLVWIFTLAFVVAAAASTSLIYTVANNKQMFKFFIHVSENFRWHPWKATHEMFTFSRYTHFAAPIFHLFFSLFLARAQFVRVSFILFPKLVNIYVKIHLCTSVLYA